MEARRASQREASRRWYAGNKEKQIAANAKRRALLREWWRGFKATLSCVRCGESHPACLDFHHRDPAEKDTTLQQMFIRGYSKERVLAEVAKCDVLCANCHRKHHWEILKAGAKGVDAGEEAE